MYITTMNAIKNAQFSVIAKKKITQSCTEIYIIIIMYLCKQVWSKYIQYSFKHYKDLQDIQWKKNTWIT